MQRQHFLIAPALAWKFECIQAYKNIFAPVNFITAQQNKSVFLTDLTEPLQALTVHPAVAKGG